MQDIFIVNGNQRLILESVQRFVDAEVRPRAATLDAQPNPEMCFSWEIVEKAHAAGIRTMTLAEKWGGLGTDSLTTSMVIEELGKGDIGVSVIMAQTLKIAQIMQHALNDEQQARVLPRFAEDPRGMLAIGITEPDNASNYFLPYPTPFRTSGQKNQGRLDRQRHEALHLQRQPCQLLPAVRADREGQAVGRRQHLLPGRTRVGPASPSAACTTRWASGLPTMPSSSSRTVSFPDENVVGTVGKGFKVLADFFPQSNAYAGATILGVAGALYEKALAWAKLRVQGGKPLIEHDGIRAQLAEMHMLIDASRSYIHRACWLADHQEHGWDKSLGALPKVMASQATWKIATWCLEIHGGHGYMKESGVEKLVRDAAAFLHSDGVNRTLLLKAANFMYA